MPLTAEVYFDCLQSYMNHEFYNVPQGNDNIVLREAIDTNDRGKKIFREVTLGYSGKLFAIKLDRQTQGNKSIDSLFSFLNNTAKPWSKRCDFVLFNYHGGQIRVFMFEFKSGTISGDTIAGQLKASKNWCKSLAQIIKAYTEETATLHLTKYVLTTHPEPATYLDNRNFLNVDPTIRHYNYTEIDGKSLDELDNSRAEQIT